jgi:hypothetical protein
VVAVDNGTSGGRRDGRDDLDRAWGELDLPAEPLATVIEVFKTPTEAARWVEFFNCVAQASKQPPKWKYPGYLRSIAEAGLDLERFQQWLDAGLDIVVLPRLAKELAAVGASPDDMRRWCSAGQSSYYLSSVLQYLHLDEALAILQNWKEPGSSDYTFAPHDEFLRLMRGGFDIVDLRWLLVQGLRGHDVFRWWRESRRGGLADWPVWHSYGVAPADATRFGAKEISPDAAGQWMATGLPIDDIMAFLDLGCSPSEALEFNQSGIQPRMLKRTAAGLEVFDPGPELDPWEEDPVPQLPDVIEPGQVAMTLWSIAPDGTPAAWDVSFTWHGSRSAEWYQDISPAGGDLSPLSSSPTTGTAAWSNGRDVDVVYHWADEGLDGEGVLAGMAPTSDNPESDHGMRDPRNWVRLAQAIIGFLYQELY